MPLLIFTKSYEKEIKLLRSTLSTWFSSFSSLSYRYHKVALSIMAYTMHVIFPTDRFSLAGATTVTKVLLGIMLLILWTQYIIYGDRRNSQFRNKGQYSSTNQETDIIYLNIKRWWTFLLFRNGEIRVKIRTEEHEYSVTQSINC